MAVSPASSTFYYPGICVREESLTLAEFKKSLLNFEVKI